MLARLLESQQVAVLPALERQVESPWAQLEVGGLDYFLHVRAGFFVLAHCSVIAFEPF